MLLFPHSLFFFFFNDTATTEIYTLSLHDALPILGRNKMLLELGGEPLVRRAARRALEAGLSPVVMVLGHEAERLRVELAGLPCDCAINPDYTGPTSGSLHLGLERLPADEIGRAHV